jgi:hypothetical protein
MKSAPKWMVVFHEEFSAETDAFPADARVGLAAMIEVLRERGPMLKRPYCDTLKGSRHANMKELRFDAADGVWRVAFAFDPKRRAVLLVGGDKSGVTPARFYKALIRKADLRYTDWIKEAKK